LVVLKNTLTMHGPMNVKYKHHQGFLLSEFLNRCIQTEISMNHGFSKREVFKIEDTKLNIAGNLINGIYKLN